MIRIFRRTGWMVILWVVCLVWARPSLAEGVYQVKGVEVTLPLTDEKNRDPRTTGMAMAKEQAWQGLQIRMLTSEDRQRHADRLREYKSGIDNLVERVVVQSEKRIMEGANAKLQMVVDVTFSRDAVHKVFDAAGFSYNENAYPSTLFLMAQVDESGAGRLSEPGHSFARTIQTAAARYGVSVMEPLGDVEDMSNLAWERVSGKDPALWNWAEERYGIRKIWAAWYGMETAEQAAADAPPAAIATLVESDANGEQRRIRLRVRKGCGTAEINGPQSCLDGPLATKFVEMILDNWSQDHAVKPDLNHAVPLRVIHERQLAGYADFLKKLTKIPGVASAHPVSLTARDVLLILDFQGPDERLLESLAHIGNQPERTPNELTIRIP
ncbi:MAG: DUF2066 domain-containing protein [Magnetococcales bacterium]|nr:DUF2066 domain-containing protein [Magnetococcales bacterium]